MKSKIPIATGPFRTAILIPAKLFEAMTNTDLEQIGRHEAAHLARRDDYTLFAQRVIEALFALHPVVRGSRARSISNAKSPATTAPPAGPNRRAPTPIASPAPSPSAAVCAPHSPQPT